MKKSKFTIFGEASPPPAPPAEAKPEPLPDLAALVANNRLEARRIRARAESLEAQANALESELVAARGVAHSQPRRADEMNRRAYDRFKSVIHPT